MTYGYLPNSSREFISDGIRASVRNSLLFGIDSLGA